MQYIQPTPSRNEPPPPVISTWFYVEHEGEESVYPQVGGRSSSPWFHAVYWRCVVDFFAASARVNTGAHHRFYTNEPVVPDVEGFDVEVFFERLGVETVVLPYASRPPEGYFGAWGNQFYVFDIAAHLAETLAAENSVALILDSDCVFTRPVAPLLSAVRQHGALTFDARISADEEQNGLTPRQMGRIYAELDEASGARGASGETPVPAYVGGEIVAATREMLAAITAEAQALWPEMRRRHDLGLPKFNEEAHMLSFIYHRLGIPLGTADPFIDRMYTWFKNATVQPGHEDLMIWHLPNEKKLGLRRLFRAVRDERSWFWALPPEAEWRQRLGRTLGVPKRSPVKWVRDVGRTVRDKVERPV